MRLHNNKEAFRELVVATALNTEGLEENKKVGNKLATNYNQQKIKIFLEQI